jgi:hypothetical protein
MLYIISDATISGGSNMKAPGEALLIKIISTFEKGTGAVLRPWLTRREGKALTDNKRLDILAIEQAGLDALAIRDGTKQLEDGNLISIPTAQVPNDISYEQAVAQFLESAKSEADYLAVKRAINLRQIAHIAGETPELVPENRTVI